MSHQAGSSKRKSRARNALGLFAAVWLNLALAPCAMAIETADDHDCPHCPPAGMQDHHAMHTGMQAEAPCAEDLADCGLDDEFSHDTRGGQPQPKDTGDELPVLAAADQPAPGPTVPSRERAPPPFERGAPGAAPPIYLLNCVFLD